MGWATECGSTLREDAEAQWQCLGRLSALPAWCHLGGSQSACPQLLDAPAQSRRRGGPEALPRPGATPARDPRAHREEGLNMESCCSAATEPTAGSVCPECGERGRSVDRITLKALLRPAGLMRLSPAEYRFCPTASCG